MVREHGLPLEEYHRAGHEITKGNPEVHKSLYSRRDDVTLANPFGPPARGWSEVFATLDRAGANYREGEVVGFENLSTVITAGRREDGDWKVVHRRADPITGASPPESVLGSAS